jgi:ribosomal protein S18 acetylase RimI-like enzyme
MPEHRNRGIGARLMTFAEERIFRESPNVFLCVTTFNTDAQRFYQRLGYRRIGVIEDFAIEGAGEILMRKTTGPQATFVPRKD